MPLRDHFHSPVTDTQPWDALDGAWPAFMVMDLNRRLPPAYIASPNIRLGANFEIDVAARRKEPNQSNFSEQDSGGGIATAVWVPPKPTLTVESDLPDQDEYEVRIVETDGRRLVAAVEIVSPANKDRPEHRRAFVAKCAALLQQGVSVSIIDLVTTRRSNLYGDLLDLIGQTDPALSPAPPSLYAVACRGYRDPSSPKHSWKLETWARTLSLGESLHTLPLWLADDLAVPLELEASYEQTCQVLRIA
jgi:hypothetical protein